jgi:hypothetical protein
VIQWDWFEEDEDDDLSDDERAFLAALRKRAAAWSCGPEYSKIVCPGDGCDQWRAVLDVCGQQERVGLIAVGVIFDGAHIRAGEVHNQCCYPYPPDQSRVKTLEDSGSPEYLARVAAEWFERILARPVERRAWLMPDGRIGHEYAFSDDGTVLSRTVPMPGHNYDRAPDLVVPVRGPGIESRGTPDGE